MIIEGVRPTPENVVEYLLRLRADQENVEISNVKIPECKKEKEEKEGSTA